MTEPDTPVAPAAGDGAPAADSAAGLQAALERAEATAAENWNRYLRAAAELENLRRRAARDVEQARRSGVERFAAELINVIDGLEMGLGSAQHATVESLLAGKEATLRLLHGVFDRFGIETLDPAGQPFDPQLHEAMSMQPAAGTEPGSVIAVMQKGYRLNDRLLRPARVVVAGEAAGDTGPATPSA
jgi:molecular chaperone GrpE